MPAIPTPPKRSFRTTEAFRPAHWVSAKTPMRGEDITGAQRALADLGHYRPWPDLGFQPVAERRLFEGLKAFQKSKGLEPDGVMGPAGPTAQALDAARHAKATAGATRPARDLLGRGANLPLDLPVGEGGANREADVKAAKAALGVLGYYPLEKARRPDGRTGKADGHDFEFGLGAFQRRFGLKPDRRMEPFGPTQAKLDDLLQPALDRAFGFDIGNPASGTAANEPLLISADPDAEPQTRAEMLEALRAHGLAHMAETRRTDALYGFEADDALDGGAWEDRLGEDQGVGAHDGEEEPEALEADPAAEGEAAARPEAAERGDAAKRIDDATDEAEAAADEELHRALEQVAPDLSGRQVFELLNLAEEHGIDAGDDEALAELADWVRENRPDFATPLRARLEGGELDVDELARRTAFHARRLKSGAETAPAAKARLADHVAVLQEQYEKQGLSETAAAERIAAQLAEATRGGGDLAELAVVLLEFAPVTGELMSAAEAAKLARELWEARENGDAVAAARIQSELSLAILGAIPFVGRLAKVGKFAGWLTRSAEQLVPRPVRANINLARFDRIRQLSTTRGDEISLAKRSKTDSYLRKMKDAERTTLQRRYNKASGDVGQDFVRKISESANMIAKKGENGEIYTHFIGHNGKTRIHDFIVEDDVERIFLGVLRKRVPRKSGFAKALEIKTGGATVRGHQKKTDDLVTLDGIHPVKPKDPPKNSQKKKSRPINEVEIWYLPVTLVPKDIYKDAIGEMLNRYKYSSQIKAEVMEIVDSLYKEAAAKRKNGISIKLVLATAITAAESLRRSTDPDDEDGMHDA